MAKQVHKLLSKNPEQQTGICAHCGPVRIKLKRQVWRCYVGYSEQRGSRRTNAIWSHGLTQEQAAQARENKSCEICGEPTKLCVDHCHITNRIRGILCVRCNFGLGYFKDSPERLNAAIHYLLKSSAPK